MKSKKMGKDVLLFKGIGYPLIAIFGIICVIPFLLIIASSFTSENYIIKNGYVLWPKDFSLAAYQLIFQNPGKILKAYLVTIFATVVGTAVSVFINAMTGFQVEKYIFLLLFLHNIVFRRIGSVVYPVCKVSAFKEYHLGTDRTDDSFCMAYYPGKRIHGRNSHGDNRIRENRRSRRFQNFCQTDSSVVQAGSRNHWTVYSTDVLE